MSEHEAPALRQFAPGPGNWVTSNDLFCLHQWFGFPFAFVSIELLGEASKLRVRAHDFDDFFGKRSQLLDLIAFGEHRHHIWNQWYRKSYILRISAAVKFAESKGVTLDIIQAKIASEEQRSKQRLFQKTE